ncbi:uncharacterized protein EI90DRAFT_3137110 [Cantharellus anzutake]|uniref:uncharacterized protein n=1 Tax=Cantharellus anzutake TaxID=1750568 RepID=UPI0019034391|nr:uncharacterized protein EI90DRAFT_3137110 [Cantharellus anzutake]KAF8312764.1 hypothetical protein EI90DRAFT_3137110 [Cantharellus anzutake]
MLSRHRNPNCNTPTHTSSAELVPPVLGKHARRPTVAIATHLAEVELSKKRRLSQGSRKSKKVPASVTNPMRDKMKSVNMTYTTADRPEYENDSSDNGSDSNDNAGRRNVEKGSHSSVLHFSDGSELNDSGEMTEPNDDEANKLQAEITALAEQMEVKRKALKLNKTRISSGRTSHHTSRVCHLPTSWDEASLSRGPSLGLVPLKGTRSSQPLSSPHPISRQSPGLDDDASKQASHSCGPMPPQTQTPNPSSRTRSSSPVASSTASVTLHGAVNLAPKASSKKAKQKANGEPSARDATLEFWCQHDNPQVFSVLNYSRPVFLQLVASNPWSLGENSLNGARSEDASIHQRFAQEALARSAQNLNLRSDQFMVEPLMITTLMKIVSNFRNRFRNAAVQAVNEYYNFSAMDDSERIESVTDLMEKSRYIWRNHRLKDGPFENPIILTVLKVFFTFKQQFISRRLGETCLDDFKNLDEHHELIALALSAIHCALESVINPKVEFSAERFAEIHEHHLFDIAEFSSKKTRRWKRICCAMFWSVAQELKRDHMYEERDGSIIDMEEQPRGNTSPWSESE